MNARLHATSPLGDTDLIRTDQVHYMHGYHVLDDHRVNGSLNIAVGGGAYIYDTACNRYLDAVGDMWCTNIGLGRKEMARTVAEQTRLLAYSNPLCDMANSRAIEFRRKLAELAPSDLDHVLFTTGGSTVVDTAIRLMHYHQNCRGKRAKKHVITWINAYHGSTFLGMSLSGKSADRLAEFDFLGERIHHLACPYYYRAPGGVGEAKFLDGLMKEFERKILELGADRVGAFISEPVFGSGGVIAPPTGYHRWIWELCQRYDVLYILGEVVISFGRLDHFFASQVVFSVQPGTILTAKNLTSDYQPLGTCIFSRRVWEVVAEPDKGYYFSHGFTYSGHPVACAAALKSIEIVEREGLPAHADEVGRYFEERLQSLRDMPIVSDVHGMRFIACVEFVADKTSKALFPESLNIGEWVHLRVQKRGLLVRPIVHLNVMSPPLILIREQVDTVIRVLRESIEETAEDLVRAGHR